MALDNDVSIDGLIDHMIVLQKLRKIPRTHVSTDTDDIKQLNKLPKPVQSQQNFVKEEINALANEISAAPKKLKLIKESLSVNNADSDEVKEAKEEISKGLEQFYNNLHTQLLKATKEYAVDVATRLHSHIDENFYQEEHTKEEHTQVKKITLEVIKSGNITDSIMDGKIRSNLIDELNDEFPSTPSAREAIILSDLVNNSKVIGTGWESYKNAVENGIQNLSADKLDKITEERNISIIFQNAINSICSALGWEKPYDVSIKDDFKQRFQAIKEKAGVEELAQDHESKIQLK